MILLEAMASARPFVSTPVGGIPSLSAGGVLVPVGDASALADALIGLLGTRKPLATSVVRGRSTARKRRASASSTQRLRDIYGELIRSRS